MITKNILTALGLMLFCSSAFAVETAKQVDTSNVTQSQKVVDEYKEYASKISKEIRDEVIAYRKEISKLNKQKRELYQKLTQEAQEYLAKEQEFRKKLPLKQKKLIAIDKEESKSSK